MNRTVTAVSMIAAMLAIIIAGAAWSADWKGVDETVVERFAEQAGRPASRPVLDTGQGDLLLFVFLLAGATGGFTAGYFFHRLFGSDARRGK